uniref:Uncharacterized protein n=1 Tax=Glossina palpalis gambiensis TaxID=67801 RepID=A0A1B0AQP8_9MUSC
MKEDMLYRIPLATQPRAGNNFDIELEEFHRLIDNEFLYIETTHTGANLPMHTPRPLEIGSFMTHCKGDSHCPENSPGPPQVSPKVLAQIRQHLKIKLNTNLDQIIIIRNLLLFSLVLLLLLIY